MGHFRCSSLVPAPYGAARVQGGTQARKGLLPNRYAGSRLRSGGLLAGGGRPDAGPLDALLFGDATAAKVGLHPRYNFKVSCGLRHLKPARTTVTALARLRPPPSGGQDEGALLTLGAA